uniref:Magnetosome protein Man3 n=1 Tax=uncultured Nitrospirota bacterium TaxID=170969 RepID=A0A142BTU8_9BACT|nr:magnetosome protein Man3 [uncultured Nitrospirota bacterium]
MSKVLIGVFVGVFISSLLYEILYRNDPELVDGLVAKLRDKIAD